MDGNPLRFEAHSPTDAIQMAVVLALGMRFAIREHAASPEYACDKLFRPSLLHKLQALGCDTVVCTAIAQALELEDVAELVPGELEPLLNRVMAALFAILKDTERQRELERQCWVGGEE